jgi:membrane protein implicated in regulation of membrane protease activity
MAQFARMLILIGLLITGAGVLLWVGERFGLGRLPGDLIWKRKDTTVYFPLVTSLVISVVLTLVLNLLSRK